MAWKGAHQADNRRGGEGKKLELRGGQRRLQLCM